MRRSRLIVGRRAGLTFLEAIISTAIFAVVVAGVASLFQGAGTTSSVVHNKTTVQLEAQRVMGLITDELKSTMVSGGGNFVHGAEGRACERLEIRSERAAGSHRDSRERHRSGAGRGPASSVELREHVGTQF